MQQKYSTNELKRYFPTAQTAVTFHHSIGLNAPHSKIIIPESLSHIRACSGLTSHYDHVRGKSIHAIGLNLLIKFYRSIKLNKTFYSQLYISIVL